MKLMTLISRYLLGLIFLVFGLNGFLNFIPQPPPPSPLAAQFGQVMMASHYMIPVFLIQVAGGILLLIGRFIPFALAILAPILVNVLTFHITMNPEGIGPGAFATVLWVILFVRYRASFAGLFEANPSIESISGSSSPLDPDRGIRT